MIALAAFQLTEFRRTKYWLAPVGSYLIFLILFWLRDSRRHPGAYGHGVIAVLVAGLALGWTLCASQDRAGWQITVVSAGSRDRAQLSRVLLAVLMLLPLVVATVLVAAAGRLNASDPLPGLIGVLLLYLLIGLLGCALGVAAGARTRPRSIPPVALGHGLILLLVLARS